MKSLIKRGEVLVMKVVGPKGESYGSFVWPIAVGSVVEAPDWSPDRKCGHGLHGWLWGLGDLSACNGQSDSAESVWMALAVVGRDVVDLDGKVKFPRCRIAAVGYRTQIANLIAAHRPANTPVPMFGQAAAGYAGQAAAGSRGQAAAGEAGQAAAGEAGQAAAGYAGQAAAGEAGQAAAGEAGQAAVEADGLATCGIGGIVRGGERAVLVALYSTGPSREDFSYSVGQVGRGGVSAETWYEGSPEGLRAVGSDDTRVKAWTEAWARFDANKAARETTAADGAAASLAAHNGGLAKKVADPIKVKP